MIKKTLLTALLILGCLLGAGEMRGQTYRIGSGTNYSSTFPFSKNYSITQQIYTRNDIFSSTTAGDEKFNHSQGGTITELYFYNSDNINITYNIDVYYKFTTTDYFTNGWGQTPTWLDPESFTLIHSGDVTFVKGDWTGIGISHTIPYNGTDNIAIMVVSKTKTNTSTKFYCYTPNSTNRQGCSSSSSDNQIDLSNLPTGSANTQINQIKFDFTPNAEDCSKPISFAYSSVTDSGATLTWNTGNEETEWQIAISDDDSTNPETIAENVTSRTKTYTSLTSNTTYYAWVRSYCDEEHQSDWVSTSFTTDCEIKVLPYSYGFEAASDFDCWTTDNCHNNTKITTGYTHADSYKFTFNNDSDKNPQTIITPELNTTENGVSVEFWYRASTGSSTPKLKVSYSITDNNVNSFDWASNYVEVTASSNSYTKFSCNFPYNNIKYVAIQFDRNGSSYNIYIDDVKISEIPIVNLPYEYGFETSSDLNDKWTMENCYSQTGLKDTPIHTGSSSFGFVHSNSYAMQYLITPQLNGTTNGALIGLYKNAPNTYCNIQIGYSTTDKAISSFTFGDVISETDEDFTYYESFCPAGTKYICIKHNGTNGQYTTLYLDDIKIIAIDKVSGAAGAWDDIAWTPSGVPSSANNVYINHAVNIPGNSTVTANEIHIGSAGSLTIADGGQLICNNEVSVTAKKSIEGWTVLNNNSGYLTDGWYFIASPLSEPYTPAAPMTSNTYDLYRLNPSTSMWENIKNTSHDFTTLTNGRGYLYANSDNTDLEFTGTIKAYEASHDMTIDNGLNLIGNPFTYTTYVNCPFYRMNSDKNAVEGVEEYWTNPIAPCTGIIVETDVQSTVTFSKEAPDPVGGAKGNIQLELSQTVNHRGTNTTETLDNAIVSFNQGSELSKFYFGTQNANIYIPQNGKEFAIVSAGQEGQIPLNFRARVNGQYTLTFSSPLTSNLSSLTLIDNLTGAHVDLLQTPSYTFQGNTTDISARFRLLFTTTGVDENDDESQTDFAFISDGQLIVNGTGTLYVYDALGRQVSVKQVTPLTSTLSPLTSGVYVLQLVDGNSVRTQKIIMK